MAHRGGHDESRRAAAVSLTALCGAHHERFVSVTESKARQGSDGSGGGASGASGAAASSPHAYASRGRGVVMHKATASPGLSPLLSPLGATRNRRSGDTFPGADFTLPPLLHLDAPAAPSAPVVVPRAELPHGASPHLPHLPVEVQNVLTLDETNGDENHL